MWKWGVIFYGQALPLSIVSLFITFVPFNAAFERDLDEGLIENYPRVIHDMRKIVKIFYDYNDSGVDTWRILVIVTSTILPIVCLSIELILGKIRVPIRQVSLTIIISLLFFLISFLLDIQKQSWPAYPNNMNWACENNLSYFVDVHDRTKIREDIDCKNLPKIKDSGEILTLEDCVELVKKSIDDVNNNDCFGSRGEHFFWDKRNFRCGCANIQNVPIDPYNTEVTECTLYKRGNNDVIQKNFMTCKEALNTEKAGKKDEFDLTYKEKYQCRPVFSNYYCPDPPRAGEETLDQCEKLESQNEINQCKTRIEIADCEKEEDHDKKMTCLTKLFCYNPKEKDPGCCPNGEYDKRCDHKRQWAHWDPFNQIWLMIIIIFFGSI